MTGTELAMAEPQIEHSVQIPLAPAHTMPPGVTTIEQHAAWPVLSQLSMPVSAEIPLGGFKVRDLLALEAGQVILSAWQETDDVRVMAAGVQTGWSEFEVEDQKLLVRLTRLA